MDAGKQARFLGFALLVVLLSKADAVDAAEFDSAYTRFELEKDCRAEPFNEQLSIFECEGYKGRKFYIQPHEHSESMGYGPSIDQPELIGDIPVNFSVVNDVLEWRLKSDGRGGWNPIATIIRYKGSAPANDGSMKPQDVLVVTKLGTLGEQACHVAHINASAISGANILAREAADTLALGFNCSEPPQRLGF